MANKAQWGLLASLVLILSAHVAPAAADGGDKALKKGDEYLVVTNYPNNLQFVDMKKDEVYKTCVLPDRFGIGTLFVSPDRTRLYVLNNGYQTIYGIDVDTCKTVFQAQLAQAGELARSMASFSLSRDGTELYAIANPMKRMIDHYEVGAPRLQVYKTDAGLKAQPVRMFPAPRQSSLMATADDGSIYVVGPDIYKMDVNTGKHSVAIPARNWKRKNFGPPDVLYLWPYETASRDFMVLYTAAQYADAKQNPATAQYKYGFFNVDLKTGKTQTQDFGPLTEVYFTGLRSPTDENVMYGVLNRLAKYDIKEQKLIKAQELNHTYYALAINTAATKLYLGGALGEISVHDPDSLERISSLKLPGGDMALATMQVFVR